MFRAVHISKPGELFKEVFFKRLLERELEGFVSRRDELTIPLAFPVCYVPLFSVKYYWLYGNYAPAWRPYVRAATHYPFLRLLPARLNGRLAIDGGAADNIPLYPILRQGTELLPEDEKFDLIFILHFDSRYDYRKIFTTDIPIFDADITIANGFKKSHLDFSEEYVDEMIRCGEEYGEKIAQRLFLGDVSHEGLVQSVNSIFMDEHAVRQRHTSIDGLVTTLNIVGRALRSDSDCIKRLF